MNKKPQMDLLTQLALNDKTIKDMTLNICDLQAINRIMDLRDDAIKIELRAFLKGYFKRDSEQIVRDISMSLAETLKPIFTKIETAETILEDHEKRISCLERKAK